MVNLKIPKGLRIGQNIYTFLVWLRQEKGFHGDNYAAGIVGDENSKSFMGDPYHISDIAFKKLYKEYYKETNEFLKDDS